MRKLQLHKKIFSWLKDRGKQIDERDTKIWRLLLLCIAISNLAIVTVITIANPTGISFLVDFIIYLLLVSIAFIIGTLSVAFILSLLYIPLPRLFIGSLTFTWALVYYILCLGSQVQNSV